MINLETITFKLSPCDQEILHRVLGIKDLPDGYTLNTGGYVMNDLYQLPDGRVLCIYEYGAIIYPSMQVYEDDPASVADNPNAPHFQWDNGDGHYWLDHDSLTLDHLIDVWSDNCELIFDEMGCADEMLIKHAATISAEERAWVELFISIWDEVSEKEEEEFSSQCHYRGE